MAAAAIALLAPTMLAPTIANAQELESFAILSGQTLTNTGPTTIIGNIGVYPGNTFTGQGSVTQTGETYLGDAVAQRMQDDLTTLYNVLAGRPTSEGGNLTGQELGGRTLLPGVYHFDTSAGLSTGQTLILDGDGDPEAVFVFNIGSTLDLGSASEIQLVNGAQGSHVFFRIGSSATLGTTSVMEGQLVALTSISLLNQAIIDCGAALARNGSVTLDTNTINFCNLTSRSFVEVITGTPPPNGDNGDDGTPPPNGDNGDDGTPPPNGDNGDDGTPPPNGDNGDDGTPPPNGDNGDDGTPPPNGDNGDNGAPPPNGDSGTAPPTNAVIVAEAIDEFVAGGGTLPVSFAILALVLTPAELVDALLQLSGEVGTAVAPSGMQSMNAFLDLTLGGRSGPTMYVAAPTIQEPVPSTVSVLGYGPGTPSANDQRFASAHAAVPQRNWGMWVAGFGDRSVTKGSATRGTHTRTSDLLGGALGFDYYPDPDTIIGIAAGVSGTRFGLSDNFGNGTMTSYHAGVHARRQFDAAYLAGALAYGYSNVSTHRTVTVGGTDSFAARFGAHNVGGHIEAGYRLGWITPYAALRGQSFRTPAYSETTVAGVSTYALDYAARTATSLRSELGAELEWSDTVSEDTTVVLRLRGAWARELSSRTGVNASFQSVVAGPSFTLDGARPHKDSLLVSAGAEIRMRDGFYVAGSLNGSLARNAHSYGGAIKLGYTW